MAAILDISKCFVQCKPEMTRECMIDGNKGVEGVFKLCQIAQSGRFFLVNVNEMGEPHGIYHADLKIVPPITSCVRKRQRER